MFQLLYYLVHALQPYLGPFCLVIAWSFSLILVWSLVSAVRDTVANAKQMHQVPCTGCRFFTQDHRLKCTVHPKVANTEEAIGCHDYNP